MMLILYNVALFIIELIHFFIQSALVYLESLFRLVVWPSKKSIAGNHVLVTGAGHGLGRELALEFARRGANLTLWDINQKGNEDTAAEVRKLGVKVNTYICDVSLREEVIKVGQKVLREVGPLDILVNNAGIMPSKPFLSQTPETIRRIIDINVMAHFWMLQTFLPKMLETGKGHIVALSSMAGRGGYANIVPYCASKFAVAGMMDALEDELRVNNAGSDIKFTTVFPGMMNTGLVKNPKVKYSMFAPMTESDAAAKRIIDGVQRNSCHVYIPAFYELYCRIVPILPRKVHLILLDHLDSGVGPHED